MIWQIMIFVHQATAECALTGQAFECLQEGFSSSCNANCIVYYDMLLQYIKTNCDPDWKGL